MKKAPPIGTAPEFKAPEREVERFELTAFEGKPSDEKPWRLTTGVSTTIDGFDREAKAWRAVDDLGQELVGKPEDSKIVVALRSLAKRLGHEL